MNTTTLALPFMAGPSIDRALDIRFKGDWGGANIHAICGWLAQELWDRSLITTRTTIHSGRGGFDGVLALEAGDVDIAIVTPAEFAHMAYHGVGACEGKPRPWLRALGRIPQDDRLIFAIDKDYGLTSFAGIRAARPALRIATSPDDGINWIGYAARKALEFSGISAAEFDAWGCRFVVAERPPDCAQLVIEGRADAILHEGISGPWWPQLEAGRAMSYIPFEPDARARAEAELGWTSDGVPAGLFPVGDDFATLNFDDFTILVRDDFPDDVADLLAWSIVSTRGALERKYKHLPTERSPIGHPIVPADMIRTLVPLHAAAAERYRSLGLAPIDEG